MAAGWVLGTAGVLLLGAHVAYFFGATCDDAFISLRYVRNLLDGHGLVFNPGERVEGYSNFLWIAALAGAGALGADLVVAAKALGLASLVLWLGASLRLAGALGLGALERGALLFLLGSLWPVGYYAVSGLETVFYAALLTAAVAAQARNDGRLTPGVAAWLLAAALTRPEGVIFAPILAAVHFARHREARSLVPAALLFAAGYAAFVGWRFAYYGAWVPNTYLVKSPTREGLGGPVGRLLIGGLDEVVAFLGHAGGPIVAALVAVGALRGRHPAAPLAAAALAGGFFFVKFAGGDWMPGYRFLVPFLPLWWLVALSGWRFLGERLAVSAAVTRAATAAVVAAVGLLALEESVRFHLDRGRYPYFVMTSEDMIAAAREIDGRYPPGTEIVSWRIGALAYYSDLVVIDTWGLTDAHIARLRYAGQATDARLAEYLLSRRPRLVLSSDRLALGEEKAYGELRYRVAAIYPQGTRSVWTLLERVEPGAEASPE